MTVGATAGYELALRQLTEIASARPGGLEILNVRPAGADGNSRQIEISLNLTGLARAPGGARIRDYERFTIEVGSTFPHNPPSVIVRHRRWAKVAHVQWGRQLCLYAAPSVEWQPGDGMRGFVERLLLWAEKAAIGDLDPDDRPLHPPVAYVGSAQEQVIVRADLGDRVPWTLRPSTGPTYLVAICEQRAHRLDVVAWKTPDDFESELITDVPATRQVAAATILVDIDLGFEYPLEARLLAAGLQDGGVDHEAFLKLLATVAAANAVTAGAGAKVPLVVVVGTPGRRLGHGPRLAHLVAWRLDELGEHIADYMAKASQFDIADLRTKILEVGELWLQVAETNWLRVMEDRPEVTVRRDSGSPATWLTGKRVLVLGCGALGAPVAEYCVRANAATVTVVDNNIVTPGILVRQPYSDSDIGMPKALALAQRLKSIRPTGDISGHVADVIALADDRANGLASFDLIIDATADTGVRAALEAARIRRTEPWPTLVTLLIGHQARHGLLAIARSEATGGAHDIFRRLGIVVAQPHRTALADVAEDFYPYPPRAATFQPEPGCSAPTFTGSAVEVAALAATMFGAAMDAIAGVAPTASRQPMAVAAVRLGANTGNSWLGWANDVVVNEQGGLQIRISKAALAEMRTEVRRGARVRGSRVETGGMLIGTLDEAVGCVLVDSVTGPPPDSRLSEVYFEHGMLGTQEAIDQSVQQSRDVSGFVGMWHTHPYGLAAPSSTDKAGMANLVTPVAGGPTQALMVIVGGDDQTWAKWRDTACAGHLPDFFAQLVRRGDSSALHPQPAPRTVYHPGGYCSAPDRQTKVTKASIVVAAMAARDMGRQPMTVRPRIGLAISGGGFRATAFGLGCLRALHDRGILDNVTVVSGISGGSLAAAMWAYGPQSFDDFDEATVELLRRGLQLEIALRALTPASIVRNGTAFIGSMLPGRLATSRRSNRTDALRAALVARAFRHKLIQDVTHPGLTTVLSATDLITTRAVRFSSRGSSCSPHGLIVEPITVAEAVAASAAFPALLPAIERSFTFMRSRDGLSSVQRVALTDGGVYDNLGLSVLEPGRSPRFTHHAYDLDYIIACDAATGAPSPANGRFLLARLARSYAITHRKSQDGGRGRLHQAVRTGELSGFVHAYLGMPDERLPLPISDLIPHQRTRTYGTNFKPMGDEDLHAITTRGEQLTRSLISYYCPEL